MDNDDKQIGRILNRREVLALLGAAGAGMIAARASGQSAAVAQGTGLAARPPVGTSLTVPGCVVRPAQTEGPYFVDEKLNRADIRSDPATGAIRQGMPLNIDVRVSRVDGGTCAPIAGAMVDIWQCDALGVYSDVRDMGALFDTRGQKFLRGYQSTDANGLAKFTTIYPGWYEGRTTHIHFKVRVNATGARAHEFTSQLYFDDAQSDEIFANAPYATNTQRRVKNGADGIFRRGGQQLLVAVEKRGGAYAGTFDIGLNLGVGGQADGRTKGRTGGQADRWSSSSQEQIAVRRATGRRSAPESFRAPVLAAILVALIGSGARAQVVSGTVLQPDGVTRAEGVVVVILDANDRVASRALTSSSGGFVVRLPSEGLHTLRALKIGFRPTLVPPFFVGRDSTVTLRVVLGGEAIRLERVQVVGRTTCRITPDSGLAVSRAWVQARTALTATAITAEANGFLSRFANYTRHSDSTEGLVVWQRTSLGSTEGPSVYASLSADSLVRVGYAELVAGELVLYGPDAEVLLSNEFASTHCFRLAPGPGSDTNSVSIEFQPARRDPRLVDVQGRLVLDRETSELRYLEFEYAGLPRAATRANAGGRVEFVRVPGGAWLVNRWLLRIPSLVLDRSAVRRSAPMAGGPLRAIDHVRASVTQVSEVGGEVLQVKLGDRTLYEGVGRRVGGHVVGPLRSNAPTAARIVLLGTDYVATPDTSGAFLLEHVIPGRYRLGASAPEFDSLGFTPVVGLVDVRDSNATGLLLEIPAVDDVYRTGCKRVDYDVTTAVLRGTVRDTVSGQAVPNATVILSWRLEQAAQGGPATTRTRRERLTTDPDGTFRLCGVPRGASVLLTAERDGRPGPAVVAMVPLDRPYVVVELYVAR